MQSETYTQIRGEFGMLHVEHGGAVTLYPPGHPYTPQPIRLSDAALEELLTALVQAQVIQAHAA